MISGIWTSGIILDIRKDLGIVQRLKNTDGLRSCNRRTIVVPWRLLLKNIQHTWDGIWWGKTILVGFEEMTFLLQLDRRTKVLNKMIPLEQRRKESTLRRRIRTRTTILVARYWGVLGFSYIAERDAHRTTLMMSDLFARSWTNWLTVHPSDKDKDARVLSSDLAMPPPFHALDQWGR